MALSPALAALAEGIATNTLTPAQQGALGDALAIVGPLLEGPSAITSAVPTDDTILAREWLAALYTIDGLPVTSAPPNLVSVTNALPLAAANPLVFTSPPLTAMGSGLFEVSASGCPVLTGGGGTVITFTLWRDYGLPGAVQLGSPGAPVTRKILPAGAGQDAEGALTPIVDAVTDELPHTWSFVASTAGTTMTDAAGHQMITVLER